MYGLSVVKGVLLFESYIGAIFKDLVRMAHVIAGPMNPGAELIVKYLRKIVL